MTPESANYGLILQALSYAQSKSGPLRACVRHNLWQTYSTMFPVGLHPAGRLRISEENWTQRRHGRGAKIISTYFLKALHEI